VGKWESEIRRRGLGTEGLRDLETKGRGESGNVRRGEMGKW